MACAKSNSPYVQHRVMPHPFRLVTVVVKVGENHAAIHNNFREDLFVILLIQQAAAAGQHHQQAAAAGQHHPLLRGGI